MQQVQDPANLKSTYIVIDQSHKADSISVTDSFWSDLDRDHGDFKGNTLLAAFEFTADWSTWEVHPNGDEIVCIMSGDAEMILRLPEGDRHLRLTHPGTFVVVPKGTWHTARIHAPTSMIFFTPGEGTRNSEAPPEFG